MQTQVKICGITSSEDALFAAEAGANLLGYIFYPPSKRFIAPRNAAQIARQVRTAFPEVRQVGVFVDEEPSNIAWTMNLVGLDLAQLHGRESDAHCRELEMLGVRCVKTIGIGTDGPLVDFRKYDCDFFLCDTHDESLKGGTGRQFDLPRIPGGIKHDKLFVAGGLTPENVAELLLQMRPYAVDVSSGVEIKPGVKSHRRIKEFIEQVRRAIRSDWQQTESLFTIPAAANIIETENEESQPGHVS